MNDHGTATPESPGSPDITGRIDAAAALLRGYDVYDVPEPWDEAGRFLTTVADSARSGAASPAAHRAFAAGSEPVRIVAEALAAAAAAAHHADERGWPELARLYSVYARRSRGAYRDHLTSYALHEAAMPSGNPMPPERLAGVVGCHPETVHEVLREVAKAFRSAHSLARAWLAHEAESVRDAHASIATGLRQAALFLGDLSDAAWLPTDPVGDEADYEMRRTQEHDVHQVRNAMAEIGKEIWFWANADRHSDHLRNLGQAIAEALIMGRTITSELSAADAGALALIAAEVPSLPQRGLRRPLYSDLARQQIVEHCAELARVTANMGELDWLPGQSAAPPLPDVLSMRLTRRILAEPETTRPFTALGCIRAETIVADVLAGFSFSAPDLEHGATLLAGAHTAEQRARHISSHSGLLDYAGPIVVFTSA